MGQIVYLKALAIIVIWSILFEMRLPRVITIYLHNGFSLQLGLGILVIVLLTLPTNDPIILIIFCIFKLGLKFLCLNHINNPLLNWSPFCFQADGLEWWMGERSVVQFGVAVGGLFVGVVNMQLNCECRVPVFMPFFLLLLKSRVGFTATGWSTGGGGLILGHFGWIDKEMMKYKQSGSECC